MDRFENKVVLITGAGDVAGAAAKRMMAEGARIAFADFSQQALDQAAADLQAAGFSAERILCVQCDVRSMDSCRHAAEAVLEKWGQIDTLLATAGITRHMDIEEMTEKDWQDVVDINLTGVYHSCKAVVPAMRKRRYGHIVVISSIGGRTGRDVGVNYAATKAGVNGLVINLGYVLGPDGITVNSVAPGPLKGKMFASMDPERIKVLSSGIRLGRLGELDDIAAAVAYMGSDDAAWTTGEVLDVNGGLQY